MDIFKARNNRKTNTNTTPLATESLRRIRLTLLLTDITSEVKECVNRDGYDAPPPTGTSE
jgi:hypothetical protein